ncbi:MAG: hypothetical protein JNK85_24810 [Verrucomicrobiales bacterium]|nr:hypothetical protein [Verrucomicrobiales bacterium]
MKLKLRRWSRLLLIAVIRWITTPDTGAAAWTAMHRSSVALPDDVYLQEIGRKVSSPVPLTAVAVAGETVFVGTAGGVQRWVGARFEAEPGMTSEVRRLRWEGGRLWAIGAPGLWVKTDTGWREVSQEPVSDVARFRGDLVASVGNQLRVFRDGTWVRWGTNAAPFGIQRLVPFQESLFIQGQGRVTFGAVGGEFGGLDAYGFRTDQAWDWGALPSSNIRDALAVGAALYLATDRGLGVVRGMSLTAVRGGDGLPVEDTTCLARGFTNDLWIGTTRGAIRSVGGQFHYFAGQRWLPDDRIQAIAVDGTSVYFATDRGLGILRYEPYTLAKKADYYEKHLVEWGQKRLGFTHKLEWDAGRQAYVREVSDNDGGYTGNYLAAQCYRYAVTGDPAARSEATNTFHALRWLEGMTGIAGFPARSVWAKGEVGHQAGHGSGGYAAEWHDTADGRFEWKGDTSSDEICSHFYSFALFLDLVAQGPEVEQAKAHLHRIATHLVEHRWRLVDVDGKPTRWGRWDPEYFETDEGKYDRGLQAVELLSFIKTAEVLTGDPRFSAAYRELVDLGYPAYTLRARNTFPPDSVLHFLDELSFWCWANLLRYEQDPDLRALYRRGYERGYEVVRVEQNPWYNFLYGALTGNDAEAGAAMEQLRGWPLDLRVWSYQNSHRADLRTPPGYVALKGGTRTFLPRETEPLRWDRWLMQADGGTGGNDVVEPGAWLLAYWMGRYHGFISAPTAKDPRFLVVDHSLDHELGARPYSGPPRPPGF